MGAAVALLALGAVVSIPGPGASPAASPVPTSHGHVDGPPVAHTGGFGEPTCRACHFDHPLNDPGGRLRLRRLPGESGPEGSAWTVSVELTRPGMGRAGLELAARYAGGPRHGAQAGRFEVDGERLEAVAAEEGGGVVYLRHTEAGSELLAPDTARWQLRWIAAERPRHPVVVHVAANAANDDASEFGDRIYADSLVLEGGP